MAFERIKRLLGIRTESVYAGPKPVEPNPSDEDEPKERKPYPGGRTFEESGRKPAMTLVYAGPRRNPPIECVYAGPQLVPPEDAEEDV